MTNPTPHGQVPEALQLADEISKAGAFPAYPRAPYEAAAAELRRLHAQVAALTAAQQGAAYAALPEKYYLAGGEVPTWDAKQMHAFADATHALRTTHVQNPAEIEHVADDVSKNGAETNMNAYAELPPSVGEYKYGGGLYTDAQMRVFADATHALRTQQPAPATQQAGEVRRAELVPGVMHCAKCKFQLNRVTLCVSDGNAYAGNNKTEPCPNGCGPLWPVTWEQEAKNCWKALEEMHERLMAAATPQPSPTAQGAESVLEDAARLDWLALAGPTSICVVIDRPHDSEVEVSTDDVTGYGKTLREALDAARKQGANHD